VARPRWLPGRSYDFPVKRPVSSRPFSDYLRQRLSMPASWARELLARGAVTVDGGVPPGNTQDLRPGMILRVAVPEGWPPHLQPAEMELSILFEDEHLLAVDKPPGICVHPSRGHMEGRTLQNAVLHRYRADFGRPGTTLAAPHRLDRDTSGILLFSRTTEAYRSLSGAFFRREVHKEYFALVDGVPAFEMTEVAQPLGMDPRNPARGAIVPLHEGGRESRTDFFVLERGRGWALVKAVPHTGRAHQIRLHLAHLGLPIAGDADYHPDPGRLGAARQMLHAGALSFRHPATGEGIRVVSPPAPDFAALLADLRRRDG